MKANDEIFVHVPGEGAQRILHPGRRLAELSEGRSGVRVQMLKDLGVGEGTDVFLLFEQARTFLQQPARVCARAEAESAPDPIPEATDAGAAEAEPRACGPVLDLETLGDPVSAESRQSYRVSALGADIEATFAGEAHCPVLDVSATGLALYAKETVALGSRQEIVLSFDGREIAGMIVVQSIRDMGNKFRYGALCVDGALREELGGVNLAIQRQQLRRMSGVDS